MAAVEHVTRVPEVHAEDVTAARAAPAPPPLPLAALHLAVLWSLAVAQPLFDVLDGAPEFFVARGSERIDILLFAFGLVLVPPALMAATGGALGLVRPTLAQAWHSVLVVILAALLAVQVLGAVVSLPAGAVLVGAVLLGIAAARVYARRAAVRTFLTVLAPAPALFLALFLTGPVGELIWEDTSAAAAAARPVAADAPVVFVVLDEFPVMSLMNPDGRINAKRFPNFARLARESTWFRNTTSVSARTQNAVPAILSARRPNRSRLPVASHYPDNLFTLLGTTYQVDAAEEVTRLCPHEICRRDGEPLGERLRSLGWDARLIYLHTVLPETIARELPHVTDTWVDFDLGDEGDADRAQQRRLDTIEDLTKRAFSHEPETRFESFIVRQSAQARRTLRYLHVMLPHTPFRHLPSGARYPLPDESGAIGDTWAASPAAARVGQQRHLLQVGYTDRLLGRLLARLRATGVYDRAALVVVSDHGASFRPGLTRRHATRASLPDLAFVPFFLKAPHQRAGGVVDRHVSTVDVVPTLADALGIRMSWRHDGRSALRPGRQPANVTILDTDYITAPYGALLRGRDTAVAEQARAFGSGGFDASFYAPGGHAGIVGRAARPAGGVAAGLSVDLDRSGAPAWVTGRLSGPAAHAGVRLAVSRGGRIAGTATAYRGPDGVAFALMLSPVRAGAGDGEIRVYRVRGRPLRLEELRTT